MTEIGCVWLFSRDRGDGGTCVWPFALATRSLDVDIGGNPGREWRMDPMVWLSPSDSYARDLDWLRANCLLNALTEG